MRLRLSFLIALVVVALTAGARGRRAAGTIGAGQQGCRPRPAPRASDLHAAERAQGHPLAGHAAADGGRQPVVPRRAGQRDPGPHRLRAPVRAHDVPGLQACGRRHPLQAARGRRRVRHQRHDRLRPYQLFRDRPLESARAGAVDRVRSHGLSPRRPRSEGARQPDGRGPERAAAERREPAVRHRRRSALSGALSHGPPVSRRRDRLARRPGRGRSSTTSSSSSSSTTRRTTPAWRSSATSIRRPPAVWSRSISAASSAGPTSPRSPRRRRR